MMRRRKRRKKKKLSKLLLPLVVVVVSILLIAWNCEGELPKRRQMGDRRGERRGEEKDLWEEAGRGDINSKKPYPATRGLGGRTFVC